MSLQPAQAKQYQNTKLSENFNLYELIKSDNFSHLMFEPTAPVIVALVKFAENVLQPLRNYAGPLRINSGYRNPRLNKAVGGVYNSVHQIYYNEEFIGVASDIVPKDKSKSLEHIAKWAYDNLPVKTVIIYRSPLVTKTPFIHIDTRVTREGKALLEKVGPNKYIPFNGDSK